MPRSPQPSRSPQCSQEQPRRGKPPGSEYEGCEAIAAQGDADGCGADEHARAADDQSPQAGGRQLAPSDDGSGGCEEVVQWGLHAHAPKSGISAARASVTVFSSNPCVVSGLTGLASLPLNSRCMRPE
jgi:hypothetical protein